MKFDFGEFLSNDIRKNCDLSTLSYLINLHQIGIVSPEIARAIVDEISSQRSNLKLIASENYSSLSVQSAMGNLLSDKYAEGVSGNRYYSGCENVDFIEDRAAELAKGLFGADHAYVQPHSGADANLVAFWAILSKRIEMPAIERLKVNSVIKLDKNSWDDLRKELGNQKLLGMDLGSGGHLTHGYRPNVSGRMFDSYSYGVDPNTGRIDYDALDKQVQEVKPLILLAGYSAYPRLIDFSRLREIADKVDAVLMVDMAHFSGLVAGKVLIGNHNPVPFADVVTSTTHKTLRGPRGGLVLCTKEFADVVDKGCPLVQGGPMPHIMAAKAVAFAEAQQKEFKEYANQIVVNAKALAQRCLQNRMKVVTGGTENHLLLLDVSIFGLTGRQGESALRDVGLTVNRNALPNDKNGSWYTSGLRIGTPALTTLGMGVAEMEKIADLIAKTLKSTHPKISAKGNSGSRYVLDDNIKKEVLQEVGDLLNDYPLYPSLDLSVLYDLVK